MTDKLTEDDISVFPEFDLSLPQVYMKKEFKTMEEAQKLKQQIISNQEEVIRLREENRQLRFQLADEQDSHSHDACRLEMERNQKVVDRLKELQKEMQNRFEELGRSLPKLNFDNREIALAKQIEIIHLSQKLQSILDSKE